MLDRLRRLLLVALTGLGLLLVALVVLGTIVLPAVRPFPIPEPEGALLVAQRGSGSGAAGTLMVRGDAIRFSAACETGSRALVEVQDVGGMELACSPEAAGGIVLSGIAPGRHAWRLTVAPSSRWSMALSTPVDLD